MKKLLILALLIASVTFMFAVESDFSDVVGYVKYELTAGDYTMIALPMNTQITTTAELAAAIDSNVSDIIVWNNGGWVQYSTATPASSFAITTGASCLVYLAGTSNVDFYCAGTLPSQASFDVAANDYTQMMLPLNRNDITTTADLASAIGPDVTDIITWNNGGWVQYSTATPASAFDINIGDGFLLFSNEAYTGWNAPAGRNISKTTTRTKVRK